MESNLNIMRAVRKLAPQRPVHFFDKPHIPASVHNSFTFSLLAPSKTLRNSTEKLCKQIYRYQFYYQNRSEVCFRDSVCVPDSKKYKRSTGTNIEIQLNCLDLFKKKVIENQEFRKIKEGLRSCQLSGLLDKIILLLSVKARLRN